MSTATDPYRVSMVCLGNICRSPIAEVVLHGMVAEEGLADRVQVTSAGTGAWHVGGPMDPGSAAVLRARGLDPDTHRAQQMTAAVVDRYDLLVAMDTSNLADLQEMVGGADHPRVVLLRDFDPDGPDGRSVPDPYGGGPEGFETVYAQVEAACAGLVAALPGLMAER
ncbi:MAG: protein tyrosine phosphatase [Klenkia sp.]|nr:protein tyrosine phosphatase [Klenkia sp.]